MSHHNHNGPPRAVLFYSQYCAYSNRVVNAIVAADTRDRYVLVCVDTHRHQIPQFVDSVPSILTPDRQLLKDEDVMTHVQFMNTVAGSARHTTTGSYGSPGGEAGPVQSSSSPSSALTDGLLSDGAADSFSYLDDTVSTLGNTFVPVDYNPRIHVPPDEDAKDVVNTHAGVGVAQRAGASTRTSASQQSLDSLISERENDLHLLRRSSGPPPPGAKIASA